MKKDIANEVTEVMKNLTMLEQQANSNLGITKEYNKKNSRIVMQKEALKLKQQLKELQEKYDAQLSQINSLIFENHKLRSELYIFQEENELKTIIKFKKDY